MTRPRLPRWNIDVDAIGGWIVLVLAIVLAIVCVYVGIARADATTPAARTPLHPVGFHTSAGIYCQFGMSAPTNDLPLGEGTVTCIYAQQAHMTGCALDRYIISVGSLTGRRVYVQPCPTTPPRFNRAVVDHTLRAGQAAASRDDAVTCTLTRRTLTCADQNEGGGFRLRPAGRLLYATAWLA